MFRASLPIDSEMPAVVAALRSNTSVVIVAPPGSGKTTRVAPGLLDAGLTQPDQQIWLLQPRRVAARSTAERIAEERGGIVGHETGYRVRFDQKVSARTRLVVATEGVLLRRMDQDPFLQGVGVVLLDEFHERSIQSDLLLAMTRRIQKAGRSDLKLVVMSATMESGPVSSWLDDAPVFASDGRMFPVGIRYIPPRGGESMIDQVVAAVSRAIREIDGDLLVFLPGMGEIAAARKRIEPLLGGKFREIHLLHGSLPIDQQSAVVRGRSGGRIILSTNVAETSLTIDGVRGVIDSGVARVLRFDPHVHLDRLQLEPVSQASAAQRAGRAGRTAEGICWRLWSESTQKSRPATLEPEIRRVDVTAAVLQLLGWGENPFEFPWFERPRDESIAAAIRLLELLGAIEAGRLSKTGSLMASIPAAPRLARMLIEGRAFGHLEQVALAIAMLSERDPFLSRSGPRSNRGSSPRTARWNCDVTERVAAIHHFLLTGEGNSPFGEIHRGAAFGIRDVARELVESVADLQVNEAPVDAAEAIPRALLAGMPDRLARRREGDSSRATMASGRGVKLDPRSGVELGELFICVDVDDGTRDANVRMASAVKRQWLDSSLLTERDELFFSPTGKTVQQRRRQFYGELMLGETPVAIDNLEECRRVLFDAAAQNLASVMPDKGAEIQVLAARVDLLRRFAPELELPAVDESLLQEVLRELCYGKKSFAELQRGPWMEWLTSRFTAVHSTIIEKEVPERIMVPSGSRIAVEYALGKSPILAVRIQEVFSWKQTPRLVFGRVPVLLHLLAPNFRPQQVTDDLESFWKNTYPVVRGELRRRYPKHSWPDDPLTAPPVKKG